MPEQVGRQSHRFGRRERLHSRKEFTTLFESGQRFFAFGVTFRYLRTDGGVSRFGVAVGRRNGNAVARNRLRRLLKEGFRLSKHRLPYGVDVVALPSPWLSLSIDRALRAFAAFAKALEQERA